MTVPTYGIAARQHVAQVATHATTMLATPKAIRNKQYNTISPGCAAISEVTLRNASYARQRRRYIMGIIKFDMSDQMSTTSTMMNTQAAITNNTYGSRRSRCKDK